MTTYFVPIDSQGDGYGNLRSLEKAIKVAETLTFGTTVIVRYYGLTPRAVRVGAKGTMIVAQFVNGKRVA
jgi:hypothetical protein